MLLGVPPMYVILNEVKDLKGKNAPVSEQPMKSLELRFFDSAALRSG